MESRKMLLLFLLKHRGDGLCVAIGQNLCSATSETVSELRQKAKQKSGPISRNLFCPGCASDGRALCLERPHAVEEVRKNRYELPWGHSRLLMVPQESLVLYWTQIHSLQSIWCSWKITDDCMVNGDMLIAVANIAMFCAQAPFYESVLGCIAPSV